MASLFVRTAVATLLLCALAPLSASAQNGASVALLRLRPGDSVRLEVRDEPGLAGDYGIDESGRVLLPLVGLVDVAGRDFEAVRRDVATAYAGELANGEIRLTPLIRIAVLGEVRAPGLYAVDPTHTIGDVLALAGGLGAAADDERVTLVRDGRVLADAQALALPLLPGDQIVVGRQSWTRENAGALVGAGGSLLVALITALLLR